MYLDTCLPLRFERSFYDFLTIITPLRPLMCFLRQPGKTVKKNGKKKIGRKMFCNKFRTHTHPEPFAAEQYFELKSGGSSN